MTEAVDRLKAALAGRYTIEGELGAGGIGSALSTAPIGRVTYCLSCSSTAYRTFGVKDTVLDTPFCH